MFVERVYVKPAGRRRRPHRLGRRCYRADAAAAIMRPSAARVAARCQAFLICKMHIPCVCRCLPDHKSAFRILRIIVAREFLAASRARSAGIGCAICSAPVHRIAPFYADVCHPPISLEELKHAHAMLRKEAKRKT